MSEAPILTSLDMETEYKIFLVKRELLQDIDLFQAVREHYKEIYDACDEQCESCRQENCTWSHCMAECIAEKLVLSGDK